MIQTKPVLLLDRSYFPVQIITWRRALDLVWFRQRAEVVKLWAGGDERAFSVIRLMYRSVPPNFRGNKNRPNKKAILRRDKYTCVYCGNTNKAEMTIDHILPRSRGGGNTYDNLASCCKSCNNYKGNLTPEEAGMRPIYGNKYYDLVDGLCLEDWSDFIRSAA